jgi:hypothetical protein
MFLRKLSTTVIGSHTDHQLAPNGDKPHRFNGYRVYGKRVMLSKGRRNIRMGWEPNVLRLGVGHGGRLSHGLATRVKILESRQAQLVRFREGVSGRGTARLWKSKTPGRVVRRVGRRGTNERGEVGPEETSIPRYGFACNATNGNRGRV